MFNLSKQRCHFLFFALFISVSLWANNSTDLASMRREIEVDLSPSPVDIFATGFMTIGSSLLIPYTCFPDVNNPEMTHMKKAACGGSIIYVIGQGTDWIHKIYNFARHR